MNITNVQFETIKSLCGIVNTLPGRKAKLKLLGDFKNLSPVVSITDGENAPYVIADSDTDYVIRSLSKYLSLRYCNA